MTRWVGTVAVAMGGTLVGCAGAVDEPYEDAQEAFEPANELGEELDEAFGCCAQAKGGWATSTTAVNCYLYGPGVTHTGKAKIVVIIGGGGEPHDRAQHQLSACPNGCDGGSVTQNIRVERACLGGANQTSTWASPTPGTWVQTGCSGSGTPDVDAVRCQLQVCAAFITGTEPGCV